MQPNQDEQITTPQSQGDSVQLSAPSAPAIQQPYHDERQVKIRSILIKMMLGCVIAAATVAVVAILIGSMNDIAWRAVGTVGAALIHILILLVIVSSAAPRDPVIARTSNYVINSSIVIVALSFFTSIFNIWDMLEGEVTWKLYVTYFVVLATIIHSKVVLDVQATYDKVRWYAYVNYGFMVLVAGLLVGLVYAPSEWRLLDGFYGRALAASAIVDVTLTAVIAVMHRLYVQKQPRLQSQDAHTGSSAGRILIIVLGVVFGIPLLGWVINSLIFISR